MKKVISAILLSLVCLGSLFSQVKKVKVVADKAVIYLEPNIGSTKIELLKKGDILNLFNPNKKNNWYYVIYQSRPGATRVTGFVQADVVELIVEEKEIIVEEKRQEEEKAIQPVTEAAVPEEKKPEISVSPPPQEVTALTEKKAQKRYGLGILAGYNMPAKESFSGGVTYGVNLWFKIAKNIALELSSLRLENKSAGDLNGLSEGKLAQTLILFGIQGRLFSEGRLVPYIVGGGDYSFNKYKLSSAMTDPWNQLGFTLTERVEDSWAFFIGGGVDFFISKNIVLNGDIKYSTGKTKGAWSLEDQISNLNVTGDLKNISLNSLDFEVGLRFLF